MGYLKYQMEGEQISFGNGEWYFTGNKRKSDNVVGRYLSSGNCEGNCDECNKVELTYSNGNIRTIPYDCNAENSMLKYDEILSISDDNCPVSSITSMEIGDCVTSVYRMYETEQQPLFRQPNLTSISSVTFSNNLTSISAPFFQHSSGLTEVSFPDSLVYIGGSAFYDCPNLKTIILNEGLKVIGSGACKNCESLSSVTFPSTILQIKYEAFYNCTSLEEIHVLSKIPPALGDNVFYGTNNCPIYVPCESVELYKNTNGWRSLSGRITCIDAVNLVEFTMPSGLKKYYPCTEAGRIDESLLSGNTNAVDMVIGECAKSIIGRFSAMTNLHDCEITIPNNSYIANHAFDGTSGVTSLTLGSGCTYEYNTGQLGSQFANMPDLAELNFVDGVDKISYDSFKGCTSLSSVTIPDSVTSIYSGAFSGCTNLRTFTIGSGVTFIDNYVIDNSPNLEAIYIYSKQISRIGTSAFDRYGGTCPIYVPCDKYYDYSSFFGAEQAARLVPMDGCPQVARVTSVTLSETAKTLNHLETFTLTPTVLPSEAANKRVTWSSSNSGICTVDSNGLVNGVGEGNAVITVTTFDGGYTATCDVTVNEVFSGKFYAVYSNGTDYAVGCDSNTTLTSETTKPSGYQYTAMTSANIGDCITRIGDEVFLDCKSLTSVTISDSVTSIGAGIFYNCSSLTSINIPSGVTIINTYTAYNCSNLTSVTMSNSVTIIYDYAFKNCTSLEKINSDVYGEFNIPTSVTTIGSQAFRNCIAANTIIIPSGVTSIGNYAFYYCRYLSSVVIYATIPPILDTSRWEQTFDNTNNCPIYVPLESVNTYKTASVWSKYASRIQAIPN